MRILVLYAHPVETSFVSGLHDAVVETLRGRGHEVDDCDLNRERFDPVLSRQGRLDYHDTARNQAGVEDHVRRLKAAEGLVLVHPVWNYGFPAILKGYVDRVFLPGVAFDLGPDGNLDFKLRHIRRLAAVCTYGGDRWRTILAGDPPKRFFKRALRVQMARGASCDYMALHDMNHTTSDRRAAFVVKVRARFSGW